MHRFFRLYLIVIAALVLTNTPCARGASELGQPAPALVIEELNGNNFDLAAQHGKVTVVNFWATWCPPCREEMPALNDFYKHHHAEGLEMIGLSADRPHDRSDVTNVMKSVSYPAAMLDDAKVNGFPEPSALPVTFIIDREGVVRAKLTPDQAPATERTLEDAVLPLLTKKTGPLPSANRLN